MEPFESPKLDLDDDVYVVVFFGGCFFGRFHVCETSGGGFFWRKKKGSNMILQEHLGNLTVGFAMLICNKAWGMWYLWMFIKFKFSWFVFYCWSISLYRISVGKCQVYTLATLGVFLDRDVDA